MTPQELAKTQRDFLIRTEKQSAVALQTEFDALKREISSHLRRNLTPGVELSAIQFIDEIIALLDLETEKFARSAAKIVARAQSRAVNFAGESLNRFFPRISNSIFSPDAPAIQQLVGRMQTGKSLVNYFRALNPHTAARARRTLLEGFAAGESSRQIASRIETATDAEKFRVLTIARTETNEAYRAASRDFYQSADIKEYIWLSVLDPRTCLTCWHLHGRKFKTSVKVSAHPNCRCVLVPSVKNQTPLATGAERFLKLEAGFQQQILGAKRFELFKGGKDFNEFVGSRRDIEYGERFFVKNLSDLM